MKKKKKKKMRKEKERERVCLFLFFAVRSFYSPCLLVWYSLSLPSLYRNCLSDLKMRSFPVDWSGRERERDGRKEESEGGSWWGADVVLFVW